MPAARRHNLFCSGRRPPALLDGAQELLTTRAFFAPCARCTAGPPGGPPPAVPARELAVNYFDLDAPRGGGCCNVCRPAFEAIHR